MPTHEKHDRFSRIDPPFPSTQKSGQQIVGSSPTSDFMDGVPWRKMMEDPVQLQEEIARLTTRVEFLEKLERSATARACRLQAARELLSENRDAWRRVAEERAAEVAFLTAELAALRASISRPDCCDGLSSATSSHVQP